MLSFDEFQKYVQENISDRLPEEYEEANVRICEVQKNNNLILHGITVTPKGSNIAPNVYLEGYFKQYEDGKSLDEVMQLITHTVLDYIKPPEEFSTIDQDFLNFDFIKERVVMVAVNAERNSQLLSQVPHQKREDLALIYKVILGSNESGMASITIRNEHMNFWGVDAETIHELAMKNTREILPICVWPIDEILKEMYAKDGISEDIAEEMPKDLQIYVISNSKKENGAASMFYDDVLSSLSEEIGTDLYILPSSVHEVIVVSTDLGTPESLSEMVREVNETTVLDVEQLSDHVYRFDAASKKLSLADTTLEELKRAENEAYKESFEKNQEDQKNVGHPRRHH